MFSALRKLTAGNNKNEINGKSPTGGHQAMHTKKICQRSTLQ